MKIRDNKGSITVFVLVGLLFMTGFLIISFGSNINKSKSAKEQFNILTGIYSHGDTDKDAYERAYTAIRRKNAQVLTKTLEDSALLELTKTFTDTLSNYRIYGNSVQSGTPSPTNPVEIQSVGDFANLFNPNAELEKVGAYLGIKTTGIDKDYTLMIKLKEGKTVPSGYFGFVHYNTAADTGASAYWLISNGTLHKNYGDGISYALVTFNPSDYYTTGICCYGATQAVWDSIMDAFEIILVEGTYHINNIPEYVEYGKYKIPVKLSGKNLYKVGEIADYYGSTSNFTISGNTIIGKNALGSSAYITNNTYYRCNNGDSYTFSFDADIGQNRIYVALYDENKNNISSTTSISGLTYNQYFAGGALYKHGTVLTINITNDSIKYLRFGLVTYDGTLETNIPITLTNIQLEKGGTRTEYEPYVGITTNIYLDEPLRKVGDVADYIDFSTGKIERKIGEIVLNGNELWYLYESGKGYRTGNSIFVDEKPLLTNRFVNTQILITNLSIRKNYENIYCYGLTEAYDTEEKWSNFLSTNPLYIYGILVNPNEPEIIELPELNTYEDYTTIEVLTEVAPSKIEATYYGYTME